MTDTTGILQRLSQAAGHAPRQAPGEGSVPYLAGFNFIQTANQIFGYRWLFKLLSERRVMLWEQALTTPIASVASALAPCPDPRSAHALQQASTPHAQARE